MVDDWDILLEDDEGKKEAWEHEWVCQSCEFGPMHGDLDKCDRCGCKKDKKFRDNIEYEDDGWGEQKETVEEIF
jgi:hypothetical protein